MEKLSAEAMYYLRVLERLKRMKDERGDDGDERDNGDDPAVFLVPLGELLKYRKISELCSTLDELRLVWALCQRQIHYTC